jgi:hypothetical protein
MSKILKKFQSDPKIYQNSFRTGAHLVELATRNPLNFRATCLTSRCTCALQQNVYILLCGHLNDLWPKDLCNNRASLPNMYEIGLYRGRLFAFPARPGSL